MIYSIKHADWQWQIMQDQISKKYTLSYKKPVQWNRCPTYFDTAELAAEAVAKGRTGLADWDSLQHPIPVPMLGSWLIDPGAASGGMVPTPVTT
jgi:hypothetical protein